MYLPDWKRFKLMLPSRLNNVKMALNKRLDKKRYENLDVNICVFMT